MDKLTEDDQKKFKTEYAYNGTPTTLFINDGKEKTAVNRIEGNVSTDKLISKLKVMALSMNNHYFFKA